MELNRSRLPSPAFVLAGLALFAALAGVAAAGVNLGSKDVKSKHISKRAVKKRHIAREAVGTKAVADASLQAEDLASGAVTQQYAAYLQPRSESKTIDVGWATSSPTPTDLQYVGPGRYRIQFTHDDGAGCAVPTATAFNASDVTFRVVGLGCNAGGSTFQLQTSNNQDSQFLLNVGFTD